LPPSDRGVDGVRYVHRQGPEQLLVLRAARQNRVDRLERGAWPRDPQGALPQAPHALFADARIQEIGNAKPDATRLVGVRRSDAPSGRSDARALRAALGQLLDR